MVKSLEIQRMVLCNTLPSAGGLVPAGNRLLLRENQLARPVVLKGFKENTVFTPRAPRPAICRTPQRGITLGSCCRATLTVGSVSWTRFSPKEATRLIPALFSLQTHYFTPGTS